MIATTNKYAPIVLFTYSRLKNTRETVEHLLANVEAAQSDIYIFSDAPKNEKAQGKVDEVRKYLHSIQGFKSVTIIEREENWGLAKNIISGITEIVDKFGRVIVLEDDHSVTPFFLKYMNEGLERYKDDERIISIHGYVYPHKEDLPEAFLIKGADCWSWATWKRGWNLFCSDAKKLYDELINEKKDKEFNFNNSYHYMDMLKRQINGTANSWAICWYASAFLNNKYTLYPGQSLMQLNDADGKDATHSSSNSLFVVDIKKGPINWALVDDKEESKEGRLMFEKFFRSLKTWKSHINDFLKLFLKR